MQDNLLYEYAIVRYVPRVEREEFINVGLIMMCKKQRWIKYQYLIDPQRFQCFNPIHTIDEVADSLNNFGCIADQADSFSRDMPVEERFRWIAAVKSSCLQVSRPHPGITSDLENEFQKLFHQYVE